MSRELTTIEFISEFFRNKNLIKNELENVDDVFNFFKFLNDNCKKYSTLYLFNYLYNFITSSEVAKRKTSARVFEDFLAIIFNGIVTDNEHRRNDTDVIGDYFKNVKDKISSNKREKADVYFKNNYAFSVKTLMPDNKEINMGSFEKTVLFDSLNVEDYLFERKGTKKSNGVGLGSIPQLRKLFEVISQKSSYTSFQEKFEKMVEIIYSDDLIVAIKDDKQMQLYFFSGSEVVNIFKNYSANSEMLLTLVNRYEGNSLRINRDTLLENCTKKITLDFSSLNETIIKNINDFDLFLHKIYVNYCNEDDNKKYSEEAFKKLKELFDEFDKNLGDLKWTNQQL